MYGLVQVMSVGVPRHNISPRKESRLLFELQLEIFSHLGPRYGWFNPRCWVQSQKFIKWNLQISIFLVESHVLSILMGLVSDFTFFVGHIPCFSQIMSNHVIHSHQVMEKSISLYKISINIYSSYMFSHLIVPSIFPFIPLDLPVATTPRHSSRGPALHEFRGALRLLRHQTGPQLPTQLLTLLMGWRKRWGYI
jgi:hypothetical protein